jgi:hypothetical protein
MHDSELNNYLTPQTWILNKAYFDYEGQRFQGRGVLRWDVSKGFSLEAPLDEKMKKIVHFKSRLIGKNDYSSIRMHLKNGGIAISPSVLLANRYDIVSESRISINLQKIIFLSRHAFQIGEGDYWRGEAIYKYNGQQTFQLLDPVQFKQQTVIDEYLFESSSSHLKGIYHQDNQGNKMILYAINEEYIYCNWKIHKDVLTKGEATRFAEAIQYALSILTGEDVYLVHYELFYGYQRRREIRRSNLHISSEYLHLLSSDMQDRSMLKEFFYKFCISLAKQTKEALICRNIFDQRSKAVCQSNWYVQEFLVSTILEAALRNIDDRPFSRKKGQSRQAWDVGSSLEKFLKNHFGNRCDVFQFKLKIMQAHCFLRDRNAHPDWLFKQGGYLSEEEMEKSFDSMVFLTHFYGYMILALLDFNNTALRFPAPISQWGANLTITPSDLNT